MLYHIIVNDTRWHLIITSLDPGGQDDTSGTQLLDGNNQAWIFALIAPEANQILF